jgi:hypothetical protein
MSYAINGTRDLPSSDVTITSTTAQELLLMQGNNPTRNNYYVPRLASGAADQLSTNDYLKYRQSMNGRMRELAGRNRTDRLVHDFGCEYSTVIEYSHHTLAEAINQGNYELLEAMAHVLRPTRHRVVVRRLQFLRARNIHCMPLSQKSAEAGLLLFHAFVANFQLKSIFATHSTTSSRLPSLRRLLRFCTRRINC